MEEHKAWAVYCYGGKITIKRQNVNGDLIRGSVIVHKNKSNLFNYKC